MIEKKYVNNSIIFKQLGEILENKDIHVQMI